MRKRLAGCLWFPIGVCIGLMWVLADIVTKNSINTFNLFNDAILLIILAGGAAFLKWQAQRHKNAKK